MKRERTFLHPETGEAFTRELTPEEYADYEALIADADAVPDPE
jgi:hypothetical protein